MTLCSPATGPRRLDAADRPLTSHSTPATHRPKHQVLVVEDDSEIAELIKLHLEDVPARVTIATDGETGLREARGGHYDLIVLDVRLPVRDGLQVCQILRGEGVFTPILMVSARAGDVDRIVGLQLGADDFLPKPFNVAELIARVKALLRRSAYGQSNASTTQSEVLEVLDVSIDRRRRRVTVGSREVHLTAKEFDLLYLLASQPGRVLSRTQILQALWRSPYQGYEHNVNCHINRLRLKMEDDPRNPRYFVTVWGVGYKFGN